MNRLEGKVGSLDQVQGLMVDLSEAARSVTTDIKVIGGLTNDLIRSFQTHAKSIVRNYREASSVLARAMGRQWDNLSSSDHHLLITDLATLRRRMLETSSDEVINELRQTVSLEPTGKRQIVSPWGRYVLARKHASNLSMSELAEDKTVFLPHIAYDHQTDNMLQKEYAKILGMLGPDQESWDEFVLGDNVVIIKDRWYPRAKQLVREQPGSIPALQYKYSLDEGEKALLFMGHPHFLDEIPTTYPGITAIFKASPFLSTDKQELLNISLDEALQSEKVQPQIFLKVDPRLFYQ